MNHPSNLWVIGIEFVRSPQDVRKLPSQPQRAQLVVCEHFDAGLLGRGAFLALVGKDLVGPSGSCGKGSMLKQVKTMPVAPAMTGNGVFLPIKMVMTGGYFSMFFTCHIQLIQLFLRRGEGILVLLNAARIKMCNAFDHQAEKSPEVFEETG